MSTDTSESVVTDRAQPAAHANPHHQRRWLALGVILIAQMMLLLDATIVNVALPSMQADLGFSDDARGWVVTAYLLAFGSLLLLGGRLADAFGRKSVFVVGLVGFAIASAVAGAAPNIETLITARAVQGGFAAVMAPAALSLIMIVFTDPKELSKAFAIFGAVAGSSAAIGLMLGGVLTDYADWRWTMYVNVAFAAVGIVGALALLHNTEETNKPKLSVPSTALGTAGVFGLVFGASRAATDGWGAAITLTSIIAGVCSWPSSLLSRRSTRTRSFRCASSPTATEAQDC